MKQPVLTTVDLPTTWRGSRSLTNCSISFLFERGWVVTAVSAPVAIVRLQSTQIYLGALRKWPHPKIGCGLDPVLRMRRYSGSRSWVWERDKRRILYGRGTPLPCSAHCVYWNALTRSLVRFRVDRRLMVRDWSKGKPDRPSRMSRIAWNDALSSI